MRRPTAALALLLLAALPAHAGDAEIRSAQSTIEGQIRAFLADDDDLAYSFAAPNIKRIFPTRDAFMSMVRSGYPMVHRPRNFSFGKVEETSPTAIVQQVLIQGPDGKEYEAVYTLELQPDGSHRITGVSLRASNALST
jgi:hypothetical protein